MRRFAIVVSNITPGGGLTKYVCNLARFLTDDSQSEVSVITTHKSEYNPEIHRLKEERGLVHYDLSEKTKVMKYLALVSLLRRLNPDIIINNYNAVLQYVLPFVKSSTKTVHILHNATSDFYRVGGINASRVTGWIAPTPALKYEFDAYMRGTVSDKITVIPHGVEAGLVAQRYGNKIAEIVYVGVLYEHKGAHILPDIIRNLENRNLDFHFSIIGEGELRGVMEHRLKKEIEDGTVEFTGRIAFEEVYKRLASADVFVYPTHLDAFGLVIAEAMINGAVPVVTCLENITDTIVTNDVTGYLVEQDDIESFSERIETLVLNPDHRMDMSEAAKKEAQTKFSIHVMKDNYQKYFSKL